MDKSSNSKLIEKPEPDDLQAFLPWACGQLQVPREVVINRNLQNEYVSAVVSDRGKTKGKSKPRLPSVVDVGDQDADTASVSQQEEDIIRINAIYDYTDNLVGLKFDKNTSLPRAVMQILGLIIKFQIYLTSLVINQGLNKYVLHEIVSFLPNSRITDICLDHCYLSEGSYFTLLENSSALRNLSLSRCRINDTVLALMVAQLCHPKPGSTTLVILNLSSNRITDVGAKCIKDMLKLNSRLTYLNLADNMITDIGASDIFSVLMEFPITKHELLDMRSRHVHYLREKRETIMQMAKELKLTDLMAKGKKVAMTKSPKQKGKGEKEDSTITSEKSVCYTDAVIFEKAQAMADSSIKPFKDPYSSENVTSRDGVTYCLGNNTLAILNLSYNSLAFPSVQHLLEVLLYQRALDRKPRGLLNCRIEGNPMPIGCTELNQIEEILDTALSGPMKRGTLAAKKKGK